MSEFNKWALLRWRSASKVHVYKITNSHIYTMQFITSASDLIHLSWCNEDTYGVESKTTPSSSFCSNSDVWNLPKLGSYGISAFLYSRSLEDTKEEVCANPLCFRLATRSSRTLQPRITDKWNQLLDLRHPYKKLWTCASRQNNWSPIGCIRYGIRWRRAAFDALNALGEEGLAKLVIVSEAHIVNGAAPAEAVKTKKLALQQLLPLVSKMWTLLDPPRYSRSR